MWKDREGKEVSAAEFRQRWAEGMKNLSPLAAAKANLIGMYIMIIGVIVGIVASLMSKQWWLFIILTGSLVVTGISTLQGWQKVKLFQSIENVEGGTI